MLCVAVCRGTLRCCARLISWHASDAQGFCMEVLRVVPLGCIACMCREQIVPIDLACFLFQLCCIPLGMLAITYHPSIA